MKFSYQDFFRKRKQALIYMSICEGSSADFASKTKLV